MTEDRPTLDDRERLRRDPGLIPLAVDEFLRYEAPLRRLADIRVDPADIERAEGVGVAFGHFAVPVTLTPGERQAA